MKRKNNSAFTLVELIVVITILAILGTIAFISLQGYSADARDSSRISDVNHIKTSLELFSLGSGKYPLPDNPEDVTYNGGTVVVWKQGTVGDIVTGNLSRNLNEKPTDPLYETEYIYSTLENGSKYEVMSVYESLAYNTLLLNNTYAANPATVKVDGTYNGLYVKSGNYIIPTPSIITSLDPTGLDFNITTIASQVTDRGTNIPNIGTSKVLQSTGGLSFSTLEVYNGTLTEKSSTGSFLGAYNALANTYSGSNIENTGIIKALLTQTTEEEKINFTKTVVLNTTSAVTSSSNGDETPPAPVALIDQTTCESANWMWISGSDGATNYDVYIGSTQSTSGFCISPRVGDFAGDTTGNGISWNGWGNQADGNYGGWDSSPIDDGNYSVDTTGNPYPQYGQTRSLDSSGGYTCASLGTATNVDTSDTIVGRMKWLVTNKVNLTAIQNIDWVIFANPLLNGHPVPALYIADCIDGVKDLGTTMTYTHNDDTTDTITYADYNTDNLENTDTAALGDVTYQDRQKYLTAWTQKTGSHLPSAFSYIENNTAGGELENLSTTNWDKYLNNTAMGEYQVACEATKLTDANDQTDAERIWLSAIGNTTGTDRGRTARIVGYSGCGDQSNYTSGNRTGNESARFVVRP